MPLRSVVQIRDWLIPWALAPLAILALVFVSATPPRELWLPMIGASLGIFLLAGAVTGLCWVLALRVLKVSPATWQSLALAALAGGLGPLLTFGLWFGTPNFSILVFAALGAIAAWRVVPASAFTHVAPAAARTT